MNEAEWLACDDPAPMLEFLQGQTSDRKLRLFAVACCRRVWGLLQSQNCRNAIETSERFADGLATDDQLRKARARARESAERSFRMIRAMPWSRAIQSQFAKRLAVSICSRNIYEALRTENTICVTADSAESYEVNLENERRHQAHLIRDVVQYSAGSVICEPSWRTSTVVALARGIYDQKAFDQMPILADALQDAGCENADILDHCRGPGPHVRGCWLVDLVLGK